MRQKFFTGIERETFPSLGSFYDCERCLEPITHPICHDCLGKQISEWLSFYPSVNRKMIKKIKNYIIEVNNSAVSGIKCMACNTKNASLCPYCFTEEIFNMLKKNKIDKMIIMDFLSTFNFDLKHEGYIAEAAKEGLY